MSNILRCIIDNKNIKYKKKVIIEHHNLKFKFIKKKSFNINIEILFV